MRGDALAALTVEERAEEIVGVFKAIKAGDWRAAEALLTRVFGKPVERLEVKRPESVEDVQAMSLDEVRALRASMATNGSSSW